MAWPETRCKQAGAWYDTISNAIGLSRDNYYKVGHAAIVLVNSETKKCHYFDFGRYHSPFGYGRVRNEDTDHELTLHTPASIIDGKINNIKTILSELKQNKACHGDGYLFASIVKGDFSSAYQKAKEMQIHSPIKYGPFIWNGTNCSRFVRTVALAGKPKLAYKLNLTVPLTISPTPSGNVNSVRATFIINEIEPECLSEQNIQTQVM